MYVYTFAQTAQCKRYESHCPKGEPFIHKQILLRRSEMLDRQQL